MKTYCKYCKEHSLELIMEEHDEVNTYHYQCKRAEECGAQLIIKGGEEIWKGPDGRR